MTHEARLVSDLPAYRHSLVVPAINRIRGQAALSGIQAQLPEPPFTAPPPPPPGRRSSPRRHSRPWPPCQRGGAVAAKWSRNRLWMNR